MIKTILSNSKNKKFLQSIYSHENSLKKLSNKELLSLIKNNLDNKSLSFAIIKEASIRTLNLDPFHTQLLGAFYLSQGKVIEMKTGEGKSLTAAIAAVYNSLLGHKSYIASVNEYLVKRDFDIYFPLFNFFDLTVDYTHSPNSKKDIYSSDIIYSVASTLIFDYLFDNMTYFKDDQSQLSRDFIIIDEIDSILIDEARTPFNVSGILSSPSFDFHQANSFVTSLVPDSDFILDFSLRSVTLLDSGVDKIESFFEIKLFQDDSSFIHFIEQSILANFFYKESIHYIIYENQIVLIDENTGVLLHGRHFSSGLQQAIEAKENIPLSPMTTIYAEITYQNYFHLFNKIAGMSGTIKTEESELSQVYGLEVVQLPTYKQNKRTDLPDLIFPTKNAKIQYLIKEVKKLHQLNIPILIGTSSVADNELIANLLLKEGLSINVLNAKNAFEESTIISQAGYAGSITIVTNMAGRGVDIKLDDISKNTGLFIFGFEKYESRRIDNQLRGRAGRQGDQGTTQFLVSLEDNIFNFLGDSKIINIIKNVGIDENEPINSKLISNQLLNAQKNIESTYFDLRKNLVQYDTIISKQRNIFYSLRNDILNYNLEQIVLKISDLTDFTTENVFTNDSLDFVALKNIYDISFDQQLSKDEFKSLLIKNIFFKYNDMPDEDTLMFLKSIYLDSLDKAWTKHIASLSDLKYGIGLRQLNHKDPLIEFNKESFFLFENFLKSIQIDILKSLLKIQFSKN